MNCEAAQKRSSISIFWSRLCCCWF